MSLVSPLVRLLRRGLLLTLALPGLAAAQILVGQTSGFSGPVAAGVKETTDGAKLWIDHVNEQGGVAGQRIELISLDDKFDPTLAATNARQLIVERNVIAIFLNRGTPHTEAILPLLQKYRVPLVAPSTGAAVLHKPLQPWVFNVRAPYQREAEKAVQHLATIGLTRVGVAHVDDSFGRDAQAGAARGFAQAGLKPVFSAGFDRAKPDFKAIADQVTQTDAQAVLVFGSGSAVVAGVREIRSRGSKAQIVTLSNNASAGFIKELGEFASGTIVTQVFPNERASAHPFVKEALDLAHAKGLAGVTPAMLEGFAGAKVLVEGLRRAGARPTRESLTAALNGIDNLDLGGGLKLGYSPANHSGLGYADLAIIGADGRFVR